MQIEFVIHGVPQGHQSWGTQSDKYYETFYGKYDIYGKAKQVFVVEVRDNSGSRSSYYSLIRPQNILAASGRPGSYFGMSIRIDGSYCTDVYSLYQLFELAYKQFISNKLIRNNGESEQYTVEAFDTNDFNLTEAKRYVLNQIQSHLGSEFEALDGTFTKKYAQIIEYYNLDDVNSEAFFNATRVDGKVVISTDYPTKDALIKSYRTKDTSQQEIKRSDDEKIESLSKENDSLKQYKEAYLSIKDDLTKGQEQIQTLSASLSTEKNNCASLRQQVTSLTNQVEQLKNAANIRQIASSLEKSMGDLLPILQTIAPKPEPIREDVHYNDPSERRHRGHTGHSQPNNRIYRIAVIILFVLLLAGIYFAIQGVKSGPRINELKRKNESLEATCAVLKGQLEQMNRNRDEAQQTVPSMESFFSIVVPSASIDVKNFSGSIMDLGKEYSVSLKNYSGTPGEWQVDGFTVNGPTNSMSIKITPNRKGELKLSYKVDGAIVKTRPFYVN